MIINYYLTEFVFNHRNILSRINGTHEKQKKFKKDRILPIRLKKCVKTYNIRWKKCVEMMIIRWKKCIFAAQNRFRIC